MTDQDPRHEALPPGTILDQAYQLTRVVSAGSMGTVYEGTQLRLSRRVAVKIMVAELTDNLEVSGAVRYTRLGDATTRSIGAVFEDNDAVTLGLRVGYRF